MRYTLCGIGSYTNDRLPEGYNQIANVRAVQLTL